MPGDHPVIVSPGARVLVVGAGFAGLATAWWLDRLGYHVTIVEIAPDLRKGGTPVDIKDKTIGIVRRMGLLEEIRARGLPPRGIAFCDAQGRIEHALPPPTIVPDMPGEQYEIDRDVLLDMLYGAIAARVAFHFGRTITRLEEEADGAVATFDDGSRAAFALVFGCDGMRSRTRRLVFGADAEHLLYLRKYGVLSVVQRPLITPDITQIHSGIGRSAMLNGYADKTDLCLGFHAETELAYDHRDKAAQRRLIRERFGDMGWRVPDILAALDDDDGFYFDKICQVRMPRWSSGRIVLVGDAAYCPSPFAGMGGSMALIGAAALHDALQHHGGDIAAAFRSYDDRLRPYVDEVQDRAVAFGMAMFAPETREALDARNRVLAESVSDGTR